MATTHAADPRADFLKLIDRPRVALSPEVQALPETNGLLQFHFTYASDAQQRVPGLLVRKPNLPGRSPVVIAMHGTGGHKRNMSLIMRRLAEKGFIAVAIDGRYHGERTKAGAGSTEYQEAITHAWRKPGEHPLFYDTVWDLLRLMDYLETREDVDAKRIGMIGYSKGGIETYFAAAVDSRVAVAVPCIGVQSFRWALDNNAWQSRIGSIPLTFAAVTKEAGVTSPDAAFVEKFFARVTPGIAGEFDGPAMLPLIAPRPLLVINGDSDDRTPLPGLQLCVAAAEKAYQAANATNQFQFLLQEKTGHQVKAESERVAIAWFERWLK